MSTILDSVTEIEEKIVEAVRSIQQPVVEYVSKGVDWAEGRFPKPTYPENLPKPGEVIETQFNFAKALLDTQREFVSELADAVAPLVRAESETDEPVKAEPAKATAAKTTKKTAK
jgi:hypothetical protein